MRGIITPISDTQQNGSTTKILRPFSQWKRNGLDPVAVFLLSWVCCMDEKPLAWYPRQSSGYPWESLSFLTFLCDFQPLSLTSWWAGPQSQRTAQALVCWLNCEPYAEPLMQFCEYSGLLTGCHECRHSGTSSLFQAARTHGENNWEYVPQTLLTGDLHIQIVMKYESFWFRNRKSE